MKKLDEKVKQEEEIKNTPIPENKIPTIEEQDEKYKEILELLGFNASKVFENKEKGQYVSLGPNLHALMKIGIEVSSKKNGGKKFPTINISDGKIKSTTFSILDNLKVSINKSSLTDLTLLIGNGMLAVTITNAQELKLKLTATYKTRDGEYSYSNSIVITLTILPDVKPGGVAPSEYLSWENLLNNIKSRKLTSKEKTIIGASLAVLIGAELFPALVIELSAVEVFTLITTNIQSIIN